MGLNVSETQRAPPVVVAPRVGKWVTAQRLSKLCASRAACPRPIRAPLWITSGSANHLLSEQIDQQQGCIAFRAVTAQANGASKEAAVWAAALADEALTAAGALVDSARHHGATIVGAPGGGAAGRAGSV